MPSKTISEKQIMKIMQGHQGFREAVRAYRPDIPLMSDKQFLSELRAIVPAPKNFATGRQVSEIYKLRARYEMHPPGRNGFIPKYSAETVRIQVRDKLLHKLSPEELEKIFGVTRTQESWYWLDEVLSIQLGRWPAEKRELLEADVLRWWRKGSELRQYA